MKKRRRKRYFTETPARAFTHRNALRAPILRLALGPLPLHHLLGQPRPPPALDAPARRLGRHVPPRRRPHRGLPPGRPAQQRRGCRHFFGAHVAHGGRSRRAVDCREGVLRKKERGTRELERREELEKTKAKRKKSKPSKSQDSRYSPRRKGWWPARTSSSTSRCGFEALKAGRKDAAKSLYFFLRWERGRG